MELNEMPRYFIDTSDGDQTFLDEEGIELANDYVARLAALDALPDMARDAIPNGDERLFSVCVRSPAGAVIYDATLSLAGRWKNGCGG